MPTEFVPAIKTHRVGTQQPFDSLNQIGARGLYDQMKMIAHQTIGMHLPAGLLTRPHPRLGENFSDPDYPEKSPHADRSGSADDKSPLGIECAAVARHRQV
jgi:hypothetical protein